MKQLIFAIIGLIILGSCNNDKSATKTLANKELKENNNTLTKFPKSVTFDDATLSGMMYKEGKFSFTVTGSDYELGQQTSDADSKMCANSAKGQHIHLIIDNQPYAAKYVHEFEYGIKDGNHNLLAFLSRSYHESIKTPNAHIVQNITVKDQSIVDTKNITGPALFYSRPKGTYIGKDTEKVMLDFYIANVSLGETYAVNATVNGNTYQLNTWQPYFLEGLPMGENKITLQLMKDGQPMSGPMTKVTRIFTLKKDPLPN